MDQWKAKLSETATIVLALIAEGHTYEQILALHPELTYKDVFAAAGEALQLAYEPQSSYQARMDEIKQKHPNAYEKWSEAEDVRLRDLHLQGMRTSEIAIELGRQPGAITSRLQKLGLADQARATRG